MSGVLRRLTAIGRLEDEKLIRTLRSTRQDEPTETDSSGYLASNGVPTCFINTSTIPSLD